MIKNLSNISLLMKIFKNFLKLEIHIYSGKFYFFQKIIHENQLYYW